MFENISLKSESELKFWMSVSWNSLSMNMKYIEWPQGQGATIVSHITSLGDEDDDM